MEQNIKLAQKVGGALVYKLVTELLALKGPKRSINSEICLDVYLTHLSEDRHSDLAMTISIPTK